MPIGILLTAAQFAAETIGHIIDLHNQGESVREAVGQDVHDILKDANARIRKHHDKHVPPPPINEAAPPIE